MELVLLVRRLVRGSVRREPVRSAGRSDPPGGPVRGPAGPLSAVRPQSGRSVVRPDRSAAARSAPLGPPVRCCGSGRSARAVVRAAGALVRPRVRTGPVAVRLPACGAEAGRAGSFVRLRARRGARFIGPCLGLPAVAAVDLVAAGRSAPPPTSAVWLTASVRRAWPAPGPPRGGVVGRSRWAWFSRRPLSVEAAFQAPGPRGGFFATCAGQRAYWPSGARPVDHALGACCRTPPDKPHKGSFG